MKEVQEYLEKVRKRMRLLELAILVLAYTIVPKMPVLGTLLVVSATAQQVLWDIVTAKIIDKEIDEE